MVSYQNPTPPAYIKPQHYPKNASLMHVKVIQCSLLLCKCYVKSVKMIPVPVNMIFPRQLISLQQIYSLLSTSRRTSTTETALAYQFQ